MWVTYNNLATGDLNQDGYDDIALIPWYGDRTRIFFGGPGGPDSTADIELPSGGASFIRIKDIDFDGNLDVVLSAGETDDPVIYLGRPQGPDTIADYTLTTDPWFAIDAGDVNGDGYYDIVGTTIDKIVIFKGSNLGWSSNDKHEISIDSKTWALRTCDLDKDGCDDIITGSDSDYFRVYFGKASWPTSPDIQKTGVTNPRGIVVAVPKGTFQRNTGTLLTELISLPIDREWDVLNIEGAVPKNTSISVTVMDDRNKPLPGYSALTDPNVDLSMITAHDEIRIKVLMKTELNTTTPVLDSVMVKWKDKMSWRDQFYGDCRVDRLLNMQISDHQLKGVPMIGSGPQLVVPSLRGDEGFMTVPKAYFDAGGLDYISMDPMDFEIVGTSAVDMADVNGDGYTDIAFAVHRTGENKYAAQSPLYLTTPVGWRSTPDHTFPTVGATDVVLVDINADGFHDVVFAQERDASTYDVNSTIFFGNVGGWNSTPDVTFATTGASDVEVMDVDGDTRLDLVFACSRDDSSTSVDSMVFLQGATGFDGSSPDQLLPTRGASGVASGDIDGDGTVDLVFANGRSGGQVEIDSYVYWGQAGGGFSSGPTQLPTLGARDVEVADLNGDDHLDLVFANEMDNNQDRSVDSYVFLGDGTRALAGPPDARLPTTGAVSVELMDLDGTGWMDVGFACQYNGSSYVCGSPVYLGTSSGWSTAPDIVIPSTGASDMMAARLFKAGQGGYQSKVIGPRDPRSVDVFHTLEYTAQLGSQISGTLYVMDSSTLEVLATIPVSNGTNSWFLGNDVRVKEHETIQLQLILQGLESPGGFSLDDLRVNWTERIERAPRVVDMDIMESRVLRLDGTTLTFNITDEYDLPEELAVTIEHRRNGTELWRGDLVQHVTHVNGTMYTADIFVKSNVPIGSYDFRLRARDTDGLHSDYVEFPNALEVMNNVPTAPEITLEPEAPKATSTLRIVVVKGATDIENSMLTYHYAWYKDGDVIQDCTGDSVPSWLLGKGQNWSVEVRAFDGDDEGPAAKAWTIILNTPPMVKEALPDPEIEEDTTDSEWLDLSNAFEDPDGDPVEWSLEGKPQHVVVDIDPVTGKVTLTPEEDWNGVEDITFVASDGEGAVSQTVTVHVTPVNDVPWFSMVSGEPAGDGPVEMSIKQGALLSIDVLVIDIEGDELVFDVNTTLFQVDGSTGAISWQPDNDQVGRLHFKMTVWDVVTPSEKVSLDFIVTVENENDPMNDPSISMPSDGASFEEGILFSLLAACTDPDTVYGQVLNFSWSSNMTGHLGYGSSLNVALTDVGTHVITLTVTDGEFQKTATINVVITAKADVTPPPDGDDDGDDGGSDQPFNYALVLGLVVVLVVIGVVLFIARTRRTTEEEEAADEEEYKREHMERAYEAVKAAADKMEADLGAEPAVPKPEPESVWIESRDEGQLTMMARETEIASSATMALFETEATEPMMSEEEAEQLRIDNLKRKYQNAIGRLPYGIPSPELAKRDWVDLAAALAMGEKKETPQGQEITQIDGRWYFSDVKDTGTFLKEHEAKKKTAPEKKRIVVTTDKIALLAKLEERFRTGEISEEAYHGLKKKYEE